MDNQTDSKTGSAKSGALRKNAYRSIAHTSGGAATKYGDTTPGTANPKYYTQENEDNATSASRNPAEMGARGLVKEAEQIQKAEDTGNYIHEWNFQRI